MGCAAGSALKLTRRSRVLPIQRCIGAARKGQPMASPTPKPITAKTNTPSATRRQRNRKKETEVID